MSTPPVLSRLRLPVIGSPLFIISGPELVIAQCKAGIVGSFPALNVSLLAACEQMQLRALPITSVGSSMWGANDPAFTWLDMEKLLNQVMTIFKYIEDKDVFQKFYSKMLAKRLVNGTSASGDAETSMISKLKDASGFEYTNKLQRMFQSRLVMGNSRNVHILDRMPRHRSDNTLPLLDHLKSPAKFLYLFSYFISFLF